MLSAQPYHCTLDKHMQPEGCENDIHDQKKEHDNKDFRGKIIKG